VADLAADAAEPSPVVAASAELTEWEFHRRYGAWDPKSPVQVAALFRDAPFTWWVVGGWSLDLERAARRHEDIDVAVLRRDVAAVREWLAAWHIWEPHPDGMRSLEPGKEIGPDREQWWIRRDAFSPWVMDVLLTPSEGDDWLFKRDHRVRRPLDTVIRETAEGVRYQAPEVTLLLKAVHARDKDVADLERVWPTLEATARGWLRESVALAHPDSAWLTHLDRLG
jgi:hypothetical protein